MVEMASRYNQSAIASGAVDLDLGTSSALPYASATFDRVLSVHTIYFWSEPLDHLREIVRVLKPSGRFVLGYKPDSEQFRNSFPDSVYAFRSVDQITALLGTAGLRLHSQVSPAPASRGVAFSIASAPVPENPGEILSSTNGSS